MLQWLEIKHLQQDDLLGFYSIFYIKNNFIRHISNIKFKNLVNTI